MKIDCPLCKNLNNSSVEEYYKEKKSFKRLFYRCSECLLIFLDPRLHLPKSLEKARYEQHNNSERSSGYENFLKTLTEPLKNYINTSMVGLDFGSGPYPMMCEIMKEEGYNLNAYDPYFEPNEALLRNTYDYVTCCEVAEHFNYPAADFKILVDLVRPSGFIGLKTSLFDSKLKTREEFSKWHYIHDDTHISLYAKESMEWIAQNFGLEIKEIGESVVIFQKNPRKTS
jgi:hypothetical protein